MNQLLPIFLPGNWPERSFSISQRSEGAPILAADVAVSNVRDDKAIPCPCGGPWGSLLSVFAPEADAMFEPTVAPVLTTSKGLVFPKTDGTQR